MGQKLLDGIKRVALFEGTDDGAAIGDTNPLPTKPGPISGRSFAYEDTSFVVGDSPIVLDVNTDLGRNAVDGYIAVDGTGDLLVEISDDGASYGSQHTLKINEVMDLSNLNIDSIRLTHSGTDTAYRILVI